MKQFDAKEKTIGDNTFYIRPLPAFSATNLSGELAGLITPILASIAPLVGNGISDMELDELATPAFTGALSSMSGDKVEKLMKKLIIQYGTISVDYENETVKLTEDIANEIFCGEVHEMFLLAYEVIRINFNGFFGKLTGQFGLEGLLTKMAVSQSTANMASSI